MGGLLIGDAFANAATAVPERPAIVFGERSLTFGELDEAANRHANALAAMGVRHRDRVVMWADNDIDAAPLFVALAKLGAAFAPANARLGVTEATEMAGLAEPSLLVVDGAHAEPGGEIARTLGIPLVQLGEQRLVQGAPSPVDVPDLHETDPHVVFFTSGSTGRSKGVVLSHRVNWLRCRGPALLEPNGPMVVVYPLFHMGAWTLALQSWLTRQTVVLLPGADAEAILDAIETHRAHRMNCIPAVWQRLLDADRDGYDVSSLRFADSGTSATPPELLDGIKAAFPSAHVRVFYGSTETGQVTMLDHDDMSRKPGSCGVPHSMVEVRLAEDGEMLVRSPLVFDGYYNDATATADAFTTDGWFRTGDVAAEDDEGFYSIVGRVKDVIRTGGETVAPSEVEAALAAHPALVDVAVVGIPDERWGEVVCAAVVLAEGAATPDVDELRAFTDGTLARFKQPRRVEVVDVIPRTPATNQVQRRVLVDGLGE